MLETLNNQSLPKQVADQLKDNYPKYYQLSQLAYYSSLQKISSSGIFAKSTCDVQCNIIFTFDGSKFNEVNRESLALFMIRTLDEEIPKLKNKYSIAYLHYEGISAFYFLKNLFNMVPENYLSRLNKIFVIQPSFKIKFMLKISFGAVNSFLASRV